MASSLACSLALATETVPKWKPSFNSKTIFLPHTQAPLHTGTRSFDEAEVRLLTQAAKPTFETIQSLVQSPQYAHEGTN